MEADTDVDISVPFYYRYLLTFIIYIMATYC